MFGKIVCLISSIMCSLPFFIVGKFGKDGVEPISFWAGDKSLKSVVLNVKDYNKEMADLYLKCGWFFLICGLIGLIEAYVGIVLLCVGSIVGIFIVYKLYKRILSRYS